MTGRLIVGALLPLTVVLGAVGGSLVPDRALAAGRAGDSAGSVPIGSASYAPPADAVHVAPWGSDSSAGGAQAPVQTLDRALALVPSSGTVVLRGGSYHDGAVVAKTVTIQNYPGEAVWLDGSTEVSGWVQDGTRWRHDNWTTRFDHSPTYVRGAPDSTRPHWQFLDPAHPMAAHPDQLWIDGRPQAQVSALAEVGPGRFYLDEGSSRLYAGSDPDGRQVRASTRQQALHIRAAGVVLRGIGIRRFAPSVWQMGAVTVEKPDATLENVVISESATTALSLQAEGATLRKVTLEASGMLGLHGRHADQLVMTDVLAGRNNSEHFNIAPVSGGVKLGVTRGVTVSGSRFVDNHGPGFWADMSVYDMVFRQSEFSRNSGDGLFLEISARVVVGDSLFLDNHRDGIKVNNTADVEIWNNTFVGNGRPLDLVQDPRRNTDRSDPAVDSRIAWPDPAMPWQLDSVRVSNNVVGLSRGEANCLLCVEDYSHQESGEAMRVAVDGNVYVRSSPSAPTWLAVWSRGAGNPAVFTTLSGLRSSTGQEARGREYVDPSAVSRDGELATSIQAESGQVAVPLPGRVASALRQTSGARHLGAWTSAGPDPIAAPPPPAARRILAEDSFTRSARAGWGEADVGGDWYTPSRADRFSVDGGSAQLELQAGDGFSARLDEVRSSQTDLRMAFSLDEVPRGAGHFVSSVVRGAGSGDYRAKVGIAPGGEVTAWLSRSSGGRDAVLGTTRPALRYDVGDTLLVRTQAVGTTPTTLRVKVWKAGSAEPTRWTTEATDSTEALQTGGWVGIEGYSTGSVSSAPTTLHVDAVHVTAVP